MSVLVGVGPQVNKFEQVSSDDHQMSVARGRAEWGGNGREGGSSSGLMFRDEREGRGPKV